MLAHVDLCSVKTTMVLVNNHLTGHSHGYIVLMCNFNHAELFSCSQCLNRMMSRPTLALPAGSRSAT